MSRVTGKPTLRSFSLSYQKKDWRAGAHQSFFCRARQSFFWYDNDKDLKVHFLVTQVICPINKVHRSEPVQAIENVFCGRGPVGTNSGLSDTLNAAQLENTPKECQYQCSDMSDGKPLSQDTTSPKLVSQLTQKQV